MKKYWAIVMALVLVFSLCVGLVACEMDGPANNTDVPEATLKAMLTLLEDQNGTKTVAVETKSSFYVLGIVRQGSTKVSVKWTVEGTDNVTIGEMDNETYQIKVNVPHTDVAINYTLVATLVNAKGEAYKDASGNVYQVKFAHTIPVTSASQEIKDLYNDSIIAKPEAGKAYKMAMYCVADGKVYYFAGKNSLDSNGEAQKHSLETTTDVKSAGDMYLEAVDGGYRIYFMDGTTKKYVETCEYDGGSYKDASLNTVETPTDGFKYRYDEEKQILVGPTTDTTGEAFLAGYTSSQGKTTTQIRGRKIDYFSKTDKNYAVHFVNAVEYTYPEFVRPTTTKGIIDAVLKLDENQKLAEGPYTLKGTVSKVTYAYSNGSMSFEMMLEDLPEQKVIVYRLTTSEDPQITEGTKVTVTGELINYGGTPEFTNAKAVKEGGGDVDPNPPTPALTKEDFMKTIATSVEAGKQYYLGLYQGTNKEALYFAGKMDDEKDTFFGTVKTTAEAAVVTLEAVEGGYRFAFMDGTTKKYVDIYEYKAGSAGTGINETPTAVFVWNATYNTFTTTCAGGEYFLGTYNSFSTISKSDVKTYLVEGKADVTSYLLHLIPVSSEEPQPETDEQKVAKAKAALENSGVTLTTANTEVALPTYTGATLVWKLAEGETAVKLSADGLKIAALSIPTDADKTVTITAEITIGKANGTATVEVIIKKPAQIEKLTIAEFLTKEVGDTEYTIEGWIVAANGTSEKAGAFVIRDNTSAVYCHTGAVVNMGDHVVLKVTRSANGSTPQIGTATIVSSDTETAMPTWEPTEIDVSDGDMTAYTAEKLAELQCTYIKAIGTTLQTNSNGNYNGYVDNVETVRIYANSELKETLADYVDKEVVLYGYVRGGSAGKFVTIQLVKIEEKTITPSQKLEAEKTALTAPVTTITAIGGTTLATKGTTYTDVTISWKLENGFDGIAVVENVLKVTKLPTEQKTVKLVATLSVAGATEPITTTKEFEVTVNAATVSAQDKIDAVMKELEKVTGFADIKSAGNIGLDPVKGTAYPEVTITWTLKDTFDGITVEDNTIKVAALPAEAGTITLVATLTIDGETVQNNTKEYTVNVAAGLKKYDCLVEGAELKTFEELKALTPAKDSSTDKYYTAGWIKSITQTTYGNMYIADEAGNEYLVYGLYNYNGKVRFDAMNEATKPAVGDYIIVYGVITKYNNDYEMKNAWLLQKNDQLFKATDEELIKEVQDAIDNADSIILKEVDKAVALPVVEGVTLTWTVPSDVTAVKLSDDGLSVIAISVENTVDVTLVANFTIGSTKGTADFIVKVIAAGTKVQQKVAALTFPDENTSDKASGYTSSWDAKIGSMEWTITNFNNNAWAGNWKYIKCGRKETNASTGSIATKNAMADAIDKVVVSIGAATVSKVNSFKLVIASDAAFSADVKEIELTIVANSELVFNITEAKTNMYYKLIIDCQGSGNKNNGIVTLNSIEYYATK